MKMEEKHLWISLVCAHDSTRHIEEELTRNLHTFIKNDDLHPKLVERLLTVLLPFLTAKVYKVNTRGHGFPFNPTERLDV